VNCFVNGRRSELFEEGVFRYKEKELSRATARSHICPESEESERTFIEEVNHGLLLNQRD